MQLIKTVIFNDDDMMTMMMMILEQCLWCCRQRLQSNQLGFL